MVITKALVLRQQYGTDTVFLQTDLPSGTPKIDPTNQVLKMDVERGHGVDYVHQHFPEVEIELLVLNYQQ